MPQSFLAFPEAWVGIYVTTLSQAVSVLQKYFPLSLVLSFVSLDLEWVGDLDSLEAVRAMTIPLMPRADQYIRLLTLARDGVVIVFDLLLIGGMCSGTILI